MGHGGKLLRVNSLGLFMVTFCFLGLFPDISWALLGCRRRLYLGFCVCEVTCACLSATAGAGAFACAGAAARLS